MIITITIIIIITTTILISIIADSYFKVETKGRRRLQPSGGSLV